MPLSKKEKRLRALQYLEETGLIEAVKDKVARQLLTCKNEDFQRIRSLATLSDMFLVTLRELVNEGELKYDD